MALSAVAIRSDSLATLRPIIASNALFKAFEGIFQMSLIVDANILLGDIRWMAFKRTDPTARSDLRELLDAKTVLAIAPTYLEHEMQVILRRLADEKGVAFEMLESYWAEYRPHITFIDMGGADSSYGDPKDAPYMKLQRRTGHLIYSRDSDISTMGGRVASAMLVASLRVYSRRAVVEYTLKLTGCGSLYLSFSAISAICRLARQFLPRARTLPKWAWWGLLLLITCAIVYSPSRAYLLNMIRSLPAKSKALGIRAFDQLSTLMEEHETFKRAADSALVKVRREANFDGPSHE